MFCVGQYGLSEYFLVRFTLGFDRANSSPKIHYKNHFRRFNNFDFNIVIVDNDFNLFENILGISIPHSAFVGTDYSSYL